MHYIFGIFRPLQINHVCRLFERGEKTPTPKISALLRKWPVLLRANSVLTKDRKTALLQTSVVVKYIGRGLVVKRPGVLIKVQMLNLVLGVGVFSLLPNHFRRMVV